MWAFKMIFFVGKIKNIEFFLHLVYEIKMFVFKWRGEFYTLNFIEGFRRNFIDNKMKQLELFSNHFNVNGKIYCFHIHMLSLFLTIQELRKQFSQTISMIYLHLVSHPTRKLILKSEIRVENSLNVFSILLHCRKTKHQQIFHFISLFYF